MKNVLNILFAGLILFTLSAAGQTTTVTGTGSIQTATNVYTFVNTSEKPVKDAPYSAEATTENVRVLGDGNKITRVTKVQLYRDGEGRTRREETTKPAGAITFGLNETITIYDPVAGYRYFLNPATRTARRMAIPPQKPGAAGRVEFSTNSSSGMTMAAKSADGKFYTVTYSSNDAAKTEELSPRTIEGVEATGKSWTTTIPAGTIGNERDIVTTSEAWYSKDLQITVLNKRSDPQTGNYTYELKNIKRSEPDKSLFTVPADYKIVDNPSPAAGRVFNFSKSN